MNDATLENSLLEAAKRDKNLISFLETLQSVYSSNNEVVTMQWENNSGIQEEYKIPSIGYLISKITNLEKNFDSISNSNIKNPRIILPDGSVRNLIISEPLQTPQPFVFATPILQYSIKNNPLKDNMTNPMATIEIPIDPAVYGGNHRFIWRKVVLEDNETNNEYFDSNLLNSRKPYLETISELRDNQIGYSNVENEARVKNSVSTEFGKFSVVKIANEVINEESGIELTYTLNTLRYKDKDNRDLTLQSGSKLVFKRSTVYEVVNVRTDVRKVSLRKIEGNLPILKGTNVLELQGKISRQTAIVPVGKESRFVLFLSPVNNNSNTASYDWGVGVGIHLYSLKNYQNIQFKDEFIDDMWNTLLALSENKILPSKEILKPNVPDIEASSLKVEVINAHKNNVNNVTRLKKLHSTKESLLEKSNAISLSLRNVKEELSALDSSDVRNSNSINELRVKESDLVEENKITIQELESVRGEIIEISDTDSFFKPKYGLVGVVPFPKSRYKNESLKLGEQPVVKLELEYRYLSINGKASEFETDKFKTSSNTEERYSVSRWEKYNKSPRKKNISGVFYDESNSDPDINSPNQYLIPMSANEILEIRVRSVSDAGYPVREIVSDWSPTKRYEFPEGLAGNESAVIDKTKSERARRDMAEEFSRRGLESHADDSFTNKDRLFKHLARNIGTNEKTPEEGNKDLQAVIDDMRGKISSLTNILEGSLGELQVRIIDSEDKQVAVVKNNTVVTIDGGLYSELVSNNSIKKGSIVEKTYFIEISNVSNGDLEILSYIPGNIDSPLSDTYDGYVFNLSEYQQFRKQFLVPITYKELRSNEFNDSTFGTYFQNKQGQGQYLYSRFRDVSLNNEMYETDYSADVSIPILSGTVTKDFIWSGGNNTNGNGFESEFAVHLNHPRIQEVVDNWAEFNNNLSRVANYDAATSTYLFNPFIQSSAASRNINDEGNEKQMGYKEFTRVLSGGNQLDSIPKMRFELEDRYLIGKKTCGMYLNISPDTKNEMSVNNPFYNKGEKIENGGKILVPITASCRLTDYYGSGDSGDGRVGGVENLQNIRYEKRIGIDILIKRREEVGLFSFDFKFGMQYQESNI